MLICTLSVSALLLFLSTLWSPILYIMLAYLFVSMAFFSVEEILCTIMCTLPFSGFLILFISSSIYMFILIAIKYIVSLVKKQQKIYKLPLILTGVLILVFSLIFYEVNDYGALQGVLLVGIFLFIYILFAYRKEVDANKCFNYLICGLIASAVMGALLYVIPTTHMFAYKVWTYGETSVKDRIFDNDGTYNRLALLAFHVNHLYAFCIMAICYIICRLLKKEKKSAKQICFYVAGLVFSLAIGVLTMSKAFIVMLGFAALMALILAIIIYKKHSLKVIIPVIIIGVAAIIIFRNKFISVLERFFSYGYSGEGKLLDTLNKITTGRVDIWKTFLAETFSSPAKALFGVGLFTKDIQAIGPHSIYIAIIYRLGIFGTILLGALIWSYTHAAGKLKCSFLSLLPFLMFLLLGLQEACLDERLYFLVLSLLFAFQSSPKTENYVAAAPAENQVQASAKQAGISQTDVQPKTNLKKQTKEK